MDKRHLPKHARDNRANQLNPIHPEYYIHVAERLKKPLSQPIGRG